MDHDVQVGREPARLGLPVVDDAQRAHHEVRSGSLEQVGERGGRLAEPHVVGEAPAEPDPREELHPRQPAALVVAQLAVEPRRLDRPPRRRSSGSPASSAATHPAPRRRSPSCVAVVVDRRARPATSPSPRCRPTAAAARSRPTRDAPGEVLVEQRARPAQPGRVDADPAVPGAQQRRAGRLDPRQVGLGQRRARRRPPATRRAPPCRTGPCGRRPAPRGRCRARRRLTVTRCSGPSSSMPSLASSAGAASMKSSACSRSSSTADGSCSAAELAPAPVTLGADGRRQREHLVLERRRGGARSPARSSARGARSHTSSAVHHLPGSASSTSSSSTSHGSRASSGSVSRTRPRTTGSPSRRRRWRSSAGDERRSSASSKSSSPERTTGSGLASAANTARIACTSGDRLRPRSGFQPPWWSTARASPSTSVDDDVVGRRARAVAADRRGDGGGVGERVAVLVGRAPAASGRP